MGEMTPETIRELARAAGIRPKEEALGELAQNQAAIIEAVERCEELQLNLHEPAINLRLERPVHDVGH